MDVLILLDKLDDLIYSSKPIPLTDQVRVEREEAYSLLDQIRVTLPEEIKHARWIVKERQEEEGRQPDEPQQPQSPNAEGHHLRDIAESIEELKRSQRPAPPPLTAAASEKVRAIIEAAEASAAEVRAEADREAHRIESDAACRGMEMRKRSAAEASARLKRADEVTAALLAEAGSASKDIEALLDRVRGPAAALADVLGDGATAVQADFDRIRARVAEAPVEGVPVDVAPVNGTPETGAATPERVPQPTEEWSYAEAMEADAQRGDDTIHAALPGPGAKVTAERLGGGDRRAEGEPDPRAEGEPDPRAEGEPDRRAEGEPELAGERPAASRHLGS